MHDYPQRGEFQQGSMNDAYRGVGNEVEKGMSATVGFMLGVMIGAGAALLLAPAPGNETRRRLGDAVKKMRHNVNEGIHQARDTMGELKEDVKTAVESGRESFARTRQGVGSTGFESGATRPPQTTP